MGSLEIFKTLQLDLGYDIAFRQSGTMQAIHTEAQYAFTRDRVLQWRAQGYSVEFLNTRTARAFEPGLNPALLGCVYLPLRGQADPRKATQALAEAATYCGAQVLTQHEVTAIHSQADETYELATTRGRLHATTLVLAAGAWCAPLGALLGLHIPIAPVRGQMWATAPVPPRVFHTISAAESSLYWNTTPEQEPATPPDLTHHHTQRLTRHLYGRQTREGEIIFGGDRQLVGYNTEPEVAGIHVNHGHAADVLPFLHNLPIARTWAGLMPFSLDGLPLIGALPQRRKAYIVSGLASSGFGRGPMAGKLLADYIHTGHRPIVLAAADPARCVTARG
jgi:sarcosine oxidase subunit beta